LGGRGEFHLGEVGNSTKVVFLLKKIFNIEKYVFPKSFFNFFSQNNKKIPLEN
jgi:hypothetical protein